MDTFAALALATESPIKGVLAGTPYTSDQPVLPPVIWRQVIGMTIWNFAVMVLMMMFGKVFMGLDYKVTDTANDNTDGGLAKRKHLTYIFHTFVMLQLFNEINCRKIGRRDFNVVESILDKNHNPFFLIIVLGIFLIQVYGCNTFPGITRTVPIGTSEWGGCIVIGSTPILISFLLKLTPESWLDRMGVDKYVDEKKNMAGADGIAGKILTNYDNVKDAGVDPTKI